jgi:hypothetical protein
MDPDGLVALGDVSPRVLREDPNAPFGIATDLDRLGRVLNSVDEETAKSAGPVLIVLDAGDMYRASKFEPQVTPEIAEEQRRQALGTLDSVVAQAQQRFGDDVVMVVSQANADTTVGQPEGLGPIIIAGEGWSGYLTSDSTQRDGMVTNLDVTATVLEILGLRQPVQVLGNSMRTIPAPSDPAARVETLTA